MNFNPLDAVWFCLHLFSFYTIGSLFVFMIERGINWETFKTWFLMDKTAPELGVLGFKKALVILFAISYSLVFWPPLEYFGTGTISVLAVLSLVVSLFGFGILWYRTLKIGRQHSDGF